MGPLASIVVVPRERFSFTRPSLESILATEAPFELVYVDGGSPPATRDYLAAQARAHGFTLIRKECFLAPNEARNLGCAAARGRYVVFIDNDVIVSPGWLEALVRCADETGAWVVGPLYLIGPPERAVIHMAGGDTRIEGGRFFERHRLVDRQLDDVRPGLRREPCDMVEFHCLLVRRDVLARLGPFDEGLLSVNEHIDLCLLVRQAGGAVYVEPEAVVTYVPPPPFRAGDRPFFLLRWSDDWNKRSLERFAEKWDLSPDDPMFLAQRHWLARHRRQAYGLIENLGRKIGRGYERFVAPGMDRVLSRVSTHRARRRRDQHLGGV